ncbi:hypothetical protein JCM11251_001099 [Rhodosporidiobolus azoricus]
MTATNVPKATLYWFTGSCWSSPAILTALEKGYKDVELEKRIVDLPKGENFAPAFLRISPEGKVPVLVVPYAHTVEEGITTKFKAITGSNAITDFLDTATLGSSAHQAPSLSPATVQRSAVQKELIELVHKDDVDPNLLLLSFRDDKEREAKLGQLPGGFLKGRQEALERYAKEVGDSDPKLKEFYQKKIAENGGLLAMYEGKQDSTEFQKTGQQLWQNIGKTLSILERKFDGDAPFLVGDQISLADIHVASWLARILAAAGATSVSDIPSALSKLESNLPSPNNKIGPKLSKWTEEVFQRESFKELYSEGFH